MNPALSSFTDRHVLAVEEPLEPGAIVGEFAVLDGRSRSAAVRAVTPCSLLRVPAPAFRKLVSTRHDIVLELLRQQVERVRSLTGRVTQTHRAAITDSLTGLDSFGFFRERLGLEVDRARATGRRDAPGRRRRRGPALRGRRREPLPRRGGRPEPGRLGRPIAKGGSPCPSR